MDLDETTVVINTAMSIKVICMTRNKALGILPFSDLDLRSRSGLKISAHVSLSAKKKKKEKKRDKTTKYKRTKYTRRERQSPSRHGREAIISPPHNPTPRLAATQQPQTVPLSAHPLFSSHHRLAMQYLAASAAAAAAEAAADVASDTARLMSIVESPLMYRLLSSSFIL